MRNKPPARRWCAHDSALWHTCSIVNAVHHRDGAGISTIPAPFTLQLAPNEAIFHVGAVTTLDEWRAVGDGSYLHTSGFFFATGRGAMTATAAFAGFQAFGNASRRKRAAAQAQPRWTTILQGTVWVGTHGLYLQSADGLFPWDWASIGLSQVTAPGTVLIQGRSDHGHISWLLHSDWAELIFVLWALARNPQNPQLATGSWLPAHWLEWADTNGYPPTSIVPPDA